VKNTDYQKKLLALCEAALETAHDDRRALLDAECTNTPGLRADLEAMLERIERDEKHTSDASSRHKYSPRNCDFGLIGSERSWRACTTLTSPA